MSTRQSANDIFESGKYDWSLFISHLAIEKILKGLWLRIMKIIHHLKFIIYLN